MDTALRDRLKIIILYLPAVVTLIKTLCGVIWAKAELPSYISAYIFEVYYSFTDGRLWFIYPAVSILVIIFAIASRPMTKRGWIFGGIALNIISIICWTILSVVSQ